MKQTGKENKVYICHTCGREIYPDDNKEYIKTRRGTEMYFHTKCIRKSMRHG